MKRRQVKRRSKVGGMEKRVDEEFTEAARGLREALVIDKNNLDVELVEQLSHLTDAGHLHTEAVSVRDGAKHHLDNTTAYADTRIREEMELGGDRVTEPKVAQAVQIDEEVQAARRAVRRASQWAAEFLSLREAFTSRGYVLRDLVQLYLGSYYADSSVSGKDSRRVKEELADEAGRARSRGRSR